MIKPRFVPGVGASLGIALTVTVIKRQVVAQKGKARLYRTFSGSLTPGG